VTEAHPNLRARDSLPAELRRAAVPIDTREWIEQRAGSAVVRVRRLPGASSAAVHGIRLADGTKLVLRRYVWPGFMTDEPDAPQREVDALRYAHQHGLPVPVVVAHDVTGAATGTGVPTILMERVPGVAVAVPDLDLLARAAASIHDVDAADFGYEYFPWYEDTTTAPPVGSARPALWETAIDLWHTARPIDPPTFVHRDFHPGNLLWSRGGLTGIVDWVNACRGPRGCDLAHCYQNLLWLADVDTADAFLRAYETRTGVALHPYWELASILEHGPSHFTPARLAEDEPRLERVVAALG